jgi:2'-5' RNA ligase
MPCWRSCEQSCRHLDYAYRAGTGTTYTIKRIEASTKRRQKEYKDGVVRVNATTTRTRTRTRSNLSVRRSMSMQASNEEIKQYSLWLRPKGRQEQDVGSVIGELANRFGTECFEPHVTLLSMFEARDEHLPEVLSELERVAKNFKPFRVPLQKKVTSGERFFQCVYVLCEKPPALVGLHDAVKTSLVGLTSSHVQLHLHLANPTYMPHLSLVYGDLSAEQKKTASQHAEEAMHMQDNHGSLWSPQGMEIESFDVYLTPMAEDHSTKDWSRVAEMKLTHSVD